MIVKAIKKDYLLGFCWSAFCVVRWRLQSGLLSEAAIVIGVEWCLSGRVAHYAHDAR